MSFLRCCHSATSFRRALVSHRGHLNPFSPCRPERIMTIESKPGIPDGPSALLHTKTAASVERLTVLLQEAEQEHRGRPAATWPRWYAAFVSERQRGASVEGAQAFADQYILGQ